MKITKLGHSCLLVEMPDRTALFDPGQLSKVNVESLQYLDDIIITHDHFDHLDEVLVQQLVDKFPKVRVKTPSTLVPKIQNVSTETDAVEGVEIFKAPHEGHPPFLNPPENIGVHYLDMLSHPGDSHSFTETKPILALPVTAPWGSTDTAVQLALQLKPQHILPIHDWHWKDEVRQQMYERLEKLFADNGITFQKLVDDEAINVKL